MRTRQILATTEVLAVTEPETPWLTFDAGGDLYRYQYGRLPHTGRRRTPTAAPVAAMARSRQAKPGHSTPTRQSRRPRERSL
jgi:hypothetical protein